MRLLRRLPRLKKIAGITGRYIINILYHISSITRLFIESCYWILIAPFKGKFPSFKEILKQMELTGVNSISIVGFVSLFFGLTLAMLTSYQLEKVGSEMLLGGLVGVSFTRELGPLLTGIVVAARVGAAITAELGSMNVYEEIDALDTMAIPPIRYLVVPRMIALVIMLPCLVIVANFVGMIGGYIIGRFSIHINSAYYIRLMLDAMELKDVYTGLFKSVFFALIIGIISCYQGFIVKGGASGVGKSTTQSVVLSIQLIIIMDSFWNAVFYFF